MTKRIKQNWKTKYKRGFTLIEVIAATAMMSLIALISFSAISTSTKAYVATSLRTQAQVFLTENVNRISHMLRYADVEVGITTPSASKSGYAYPGEAYANGSPVFCPREDGGYIGYFRNNTTTGEIDFVSVVDGTRHPVVAGSPKHALKASVMFSEISEDRFVFRVKVTAYAGAEEEKTTFVKGENQVDCETVDLEIVPVETLIRHGLNRLE